MTSDTRFAPSTASSPFARPATRVNTFWNADLGARKNVHLQVAPVSDEVGCSCGELISVRVQLGREREETRRIRQSQDTGVS